MKLDPDVKGWYYIPINPQKFYKSREKVDDFTERTQTYMSAK